MVSVARPDRELLHQHVLALEQLPRGDQADAGVNGEGEDTLPDDRPVDGALEEGLPAVLGAGEGVTEGVPSGVISALPPGEADPSGDAEALDAALMTSR